MGDLQQFKELSRTCGAMPREDEGHLVEQFDLCLHRRVVTEMNRHVLRLHQRWHHVQHVEHLPVVAQLAEIALGSRPPPALQVGSMGAATPGWNVRLPSSSRRSRPGAAPRIVMLRGAAANAVATISRSRKTIWLSSSTRAPAAPRRPPAPRARRTRTPSSSRTRRDVSCIAAILVVRKDPHLRERITELPVVRFAVGLRLLVAGASAPGSMRVPHLACSRRWKRCIGASRCRN